MKQQKDDFMKTVIITMAAFLLVFTIIMIAVYLVCGDVPDSLIVAVFGACVGEGTITGMLQKAKIHKSIDTEIVADEVDDDDSDIDSNIYLDADMEE